MCSYKSLELSKVFPMLIYLRLSQFRRCFSVTFLSLYAMFVAVYYKSSDNDMSAKPESSGRRREEVCSSKDSASNALHGDAIGTTRREGQKKLASIFFARCSDITESVEA